MSQFHKKTVIYLEVDRAEKMQLLEALNCFNI